MKEAVRVYAAHNFCMLHSDRSVLSQTFVTISTVHACIYVGVHRCMYVFKYLHNSKKSVYNGMAFKSQLIIVILILLNDLSSVALLYSVQVTTV